MKQWYYSKTAWFNILTFVAVIITMIVEPGFNLQTGLPLLFGAVANFILRFSSTEIVTFGKPAYATIEAVELQTDNQLEEAILSLILAVEALNARMGALNTEASRPEDSEDSNHGRSPESIES